MATLTQAEMAMLTLVGGAVVTSSMWFFALPLGLVSSALALAMLAIMVVDAKSYIVPDVISLPAIPAGLLASGSLFHSGELAIVSPHHFAGMVVAGLAFYGIRIIYQRVRSQEGLGFGDVKLAAAAGAWVGIGSVVYVVLLACVSALVLIGVLVMTGRKKELSGTTRLPFGSFLAVALWLVWFFGQVVSGG